MPEARSRGYQPGPLQLQRASGGRCEACQGDGVIKVEMHFLPDVYVPCDVCKGQRYNRETLDIRYKGRNIHEVLEMTVEDAAGVLQRDARRSQRKLADADRRRAVATCALGQNATTLSGGEAQRVKLARELSKRDTGQHALHPRRADHRPALPRHRAAAEGAACSCGTTATPIVVIEHNLDVIKTADWIVDLGPEGGDGGGRAGGGGHAGADRGASGQSIPGGFWRRCWGLTHTSRSSPMHATAWVRSLSVGAVGALQHRPDRRSVGSRLPAVSPPPPAAFATPPASSPPVPCRFRPTVFQADRLEFQQVIEQGVLPHVGPHPQHQVGVAPVQRRFRVHDVERVVEQRHQKGGFDHPVRCSSAGHGCRRP
ncbi:MAG: hypothetical protein MZW92_41680 [Comamonadaceae bacterium]|nr:hypothetical protein [Comamonadaceae bacterium]